MSLVVLSNQYDKKNEILENPSKWRNFLTNSFTIKKDSQVAVESVKIVKSGVYSVPESFYIYGYFNNTAYNDNDNSGEYSILGTILKEDRENRTDINVNTLAKVLTNTIKYAFPHPNFQNSLTKATALLDANTGEFNGINYTLNYDGTLTNAINTSSTDWDKYPVAVNLGIQGQPQPTIQLDENTQTISVSNNSSWNTLIYKKAPLSLAGGKFKTNLPDKAGFMVGLKRIGHYIEETTEYKSPYYSLDVVPEIANVNSLPPNSDLQKLITKVKPDFCVYTRAVGAGSKFLEIAHITYDGDKCIFNVIDYYTNNANISNSIITLTNKSKFVEFVCTGEKIEINVDLGIGGGTQTIYSNDNSNTANCNLKPIYAECWNLYPCIAIPKNNNTQIEIMEINNNLNFDYDSKTNFMNYDLNQRYIAQGKLELLEKLDKLTHAKSLTDFARVSNVYTNYNPTFVLSPQNELTRNARGMKTLGFNFGLVNDFTQAGASWNIDSNTDIEIVNSRALFVRLDNFNQLSYNAGINRESKIIYSLPRFSNNGKDTNSLFFQAPEKTYIDLNNASDIDINSFDVSIVNEDETLADLTGKTIVVIHIRDKPK